jgi:hypothetical protein
VVCRRKKDRRERQTLDPDRRRDQLDGRRLNPLGRFDQLGSVLMVIRLDHRMINSSLRALRFVPVRRQPGVQYTQDYHQPRGRQRAKGAGAHAADDTR